MEDGLGEGEHGERKTSRAAVKVLVRANRSEEMQYETATCLGWYHDRCTYLSRGRRPNSKLDQQLLKLLIFHRFLIFFRQWHQRNR